MVAKDFQKIKGSSKAEVGEIDTTSPFQSVKDAVSLFGEGAFSGEKPSVKTPKPQSAERVLAKETQLHLAQKELNNLNEQLKNAETTKSQALLELEKAKRTVEDMTQKLKIINESKDSAITSTEASKHQANQFTAPNKNDKSKRTNEFSNMDLETERVQYISALTELDAAKQELRKIRQEYNVSLEAKAVAEKQEAEAEKAAKANMGRADELSEEIASIRDSILQVKLANVRVKEDETKMCADKDEHKQSFKARLEESGNKLHALRKDIDPELAKNLETRLADALSEIEAIQSEMDSARAADLDSVKTVTMKLSGAKESLNRVVEEESSLRSLVEKLKLELDSIKNEHSELKDKEAETESNADNLHVKLRKAKFELEEALAKEARIRSVSDEMIASIQKLALESENAKREARETKQKSEELKREAEATKIELEEAEKKLEVTMDEAEEAKAAEAKALHQIKTLSEKTNAARTSMSEPGAQITISKDEFESLNRKVEESDKLADMKVAAAMAQVEAVKAGENEVLKRLESTQKELENMKAGTEEALKKAEMAEAAKKAVEGELRRWREREEKKVADTASRILTETEKLSFELQPIDKEKVVGMRKLEKAKTSSVAKKALRMPSLMSSVFRKKKNRVEGASPSYLPGEKPVW